jgi:NADPH:quinone reductase
VLVAPVLYVDTQIRAGLARDWFPVTPPYVPGAGVAGRVVTVGEGTDPGWLNRLVVADTTRAGGYLAEAVLPAESLVEVPAGLGAAEAARREITVSGIAEVRFGPEKGRRLIARALNEAASGRLAPVTGQRFPLAEAAEAHRAIEARDVIGKTLLEV